MTLEIKYKVAIASKPRGNWRPECTLELILKIMGAPPEYDRLPLPTVLLANEGSLWFIETHPFYLEDIPVLRVTTSSPGTLMCRGELSCELYAPREGDYILPLPGLIYASPYEGDGYYYEGMLLVRHNFRLAQEQDALVYSVRQRVFLPHRPGENPDYGDWLKVLSVVPRLLAKLWRNNSLEKKGRVPSPSSIDWLWDSSPSFV